MSGPDVRREREDREGIKGQQLRVTAEDRYLFRKKGGRERRPARTNVSRRGGVEEIGPGKNGKYAGKVKRKRGKTCGEKVGGSRVTR